ncbi:YihY/virulence factor BrkB family protein [Streptomyces sp. NBC_01007]|nr:YihY/virulence factor BrkB family protein [Streptomyces sp. NBC_01007]
MEERAPDAPTKLPRQAWGKVFSGSLREFKEDELADRAAALTYYGVLALFPALLVLVSLLGITGRSTTDKVLNNLRQLAPGPARDIITRAVEQLQGNAGTGSIVAIVGLVVAGHRRGHAPGGRALHRAARHISHLPPSHSRHRQRQLPNSDGDAQLGSPQGRTAGARGAGLTKAEVAPPTSAALGIY